MATLLEERIGCHHLDFQDFALLHGAESAEQLVGQNIFLEWDAKFSISNSPVRQKQTSPEANFLSSRLRSNKWGNGTSCGGTMIGGT